MKAAPLSTRESYKSKPRAKPETKTIPVNFRDDNDDEDSAFNGTGEEYDHQDQDGEDEEDTGDDSEHEGGTSDSTVTLVCVLIAPK